MDHYGKKLFREDSTGISTVELLQERVNAAVEYGKLSKYESFCIGSMTEQNIAVKLLDPSLTEEEKNKCRDLMLDTFSPTVVDRCIAFVRQIVFDKYKENLFGDRFENYVYMLSGNNSEIELKEFETSDHWYDINIEDEKLKSKLAAWKFKELILQIHQEKQNKDGDNPEPLVNCIRQELMRDGGIALDEGTIQAMIEFEKACRVKNNIENVKKAKVEGVDNKSAEKQSGKTSKEKNNTLNVAKGDIIRLGSYREQELGWIVLEKTKDRLLLLSHALIDFKPYVNNYTAFAGENLSEWVGKHLKLLIAAEPKLKKNIECIRLPEYNEVKDYLEVWKPSMPGNQNATGFDSPRNAYWLNNADRSYSALKLGVDLNESKTKLFNQRYWLGVRPIMEIKLPVQGWME